MRKFKLGIRSGIKLPQGGFSLAKLKECGLLSYTKKLTGGIGVDLVGKSSRPAVPGQKILGDGVTYLTQSVIIPNENTIFKVIGNYKSLSPIEQRMGSRDGFLVNEFRFGLNGTQFRGWYGDKTSSGIVADTNVHEFKLSKDGFYLDNVLIGNFDSAVFTTPINPISILSYNSGSLVCNFNLLECEVIHNGITYTLNTTQSDTKAVQYQLVPDDTSIEPIIVQQFFAPDPVTESDIQVVSMHDEYGYTDADGVTLYKDEALTLLYPVNSIVPNYHNGTTSTGYVDNGLGVGVHPQGQYLGRIKLDVRPVNGVVDSGLDYEKWTLDNGLNNSDKDGLDITLLSEVLVVETVNDDIKPSTQYTIVFDVSLNTLDVGIRVSGSRTCFNSTLPIVPPSETGEFRALILSDSVIVAPVGFSANPDGVANGTLKCKISYYEGDYATGTPDLPPTGTYAIGNSWTLTDTQHIYAQKDTLRLATNEDGTPKVVPVADTPNIWNNQLFTDFPNNKIAMFDGPLAGGCLEETLSDFKFLDPVQVEGGTPVIVDGEKTYVLKSGVTQA